MIFNKINVFAPFIALLLVFSMKGSVYAESIENSIQELDNIAIGVSFPLDLSNYSEYEGGVDD